MPPFIRWFLQLVPTNPIVVRLVQGGSKRTRHLMIRSAYLAVLIVALLFLLLAPTSGGQMQFRDLAAAGASAFVWVAYLQVALICILSPVFMAGAIAQESNPRTWDILLSTPLSAAQLVLGQLFGRLFFILALLLASLPLFAVTQYFGGVPGDAVVASYAVSACAALFVGAVAVALAVNRLAGRRAVFTFYICVVTYLAVTVGIDASIRAAGAPGVTVMTPTNPFLALHALLDPIGYPTPGPLEQAKMSRLERLWFGSPVLSWCLLSGGLSVVMMGASTLAVRTIGSKTGVPWYRRMLGLSAGGPRHRAPRTVSHNPIAWRESIAKRATLIKRIMRWVFLGSGVALGALLLYLFHDGTLAATQFRFWLLVIVWTELIVITLIAINLSATAISKEREDGTLDLLLTTPITPTYYLGGKLKGLVLYLIPLTAVPMITLAFASLYVLVGGFGRPEDEIMVPPPTGGGIATPVVLPEAALIVPPAVISFLAFAVMVGLGWSLRSRGALSSVVGTVAAVGVVGGIFGLCGWQAGEKIPFLGPLLTALNPMTYVLAAINPAESLESTISNADLTAARVALAIGAALCVGVYAIVVLGMRTSMVKGFDMTVRKLAGTR